MEYKVLKKQNSSDKCIVCGFDNNSSLFANFYEVEGDLLVGICTAKDHHQSYPNHMHGGMICALLDETIGRAMQIGDENIWAVTTEINVKYRKPVPLNEEIKCIGKITERKSRIVTGKGYIEDSKGNVLASAKGTFMICPIEKIADGTLNEENWHLIENPKPKSIDIKSLNYFDRI